MHMANGGTQHAGRIEHALGVPDGDGFTAFVVPELLDLQNLPNRLRNAQVTGRQQDHEAVVALFIDDHLAEGADLVHAGVGTGVGQKDQSGIEFGGDAVSHFLDC